MNKFLPAGVVALACAAPIGAPAQDAAAEIKALRNELEMMRAGYEARLRALEERLKEAQAAPAAPAPSVPAAPNASAAASPTRTPVPAPAPLTRAASAASAFNPALSLILSGTYARTTRDPATYSIAGLQLPEGAEIGPGSRGFSLAESELGLSASIDPWLRGAAFIALAPDDTVSVEEAYVQTTALGAGLSAKAGRFFSGIGYLNEQHAHVWDFVDNPLAYQVFLGRQYGDDGIQLRWLAPTDLFVRLGAELGRGRGFPGTDTSRNGAGMFALQAHFGGDIGDTTSWRAGLSTLKAKATDQALVGITADGSSVSNAFSGDTRVTVLDGVVKWAPAGTRTSLKLQGEFLRSRRSGMLVFDAPGAATADAYSARQSGWYMQAVYQFLPRWRLGLRTERLHAGSVDYGLNAESFSASASDPRKHTVMLEFNPSEFSRVRMQFADDRAREAARDRQFFIQYQVNLGAHGAHGY